MTNDNKNLIKNVKTAVLSFEFWDANKIGIYLWASKCFLLPNTKLEVFTIFSGSNLHFGENLSNVGLWVEVKFSKNWLKNVLYLKKCFSTKVL